MNQRTIIGLLSIHSDSSTCIILYNLETRTWSRHNCNYPAFKINYMPTNENTMSKYKFQLLYIKLLQISFYPNYRYVPLHPLSLFPHYIAIPIRYLLFVCICLTNFIYISNITVILNKYSFILNNFLFYKI